MRLGRSIGFINFRWLVPGAVAALVALVVAGCGGGGSSSSGGSSDSFTSGAETACTAANKQISALGTPQQSEVLEYLQSTETVIGKLHTEVEKLGAAGTAEKKYVTALGEAVTVINEMSNAARSENFDAVRELSDELIKFHLGELAKAAELKSCAEVPVSNS